MSRKIRRKKGWAVWLLAAVFIGISTGYAQDYKTISVKELRNKIEG
jgi:hypothetical protein